MFGLFKRRTWVPETLAQLHGTYRELDVWIRNLPCLREKDGSGLKYPYSDFGSEFLLNLYQQLGSTDTLATRLNMGTSAKVTVKLQSYPPISIELRGRADSKLQQFESDIAEALVVAFRNAKLRPS